MIRAMRIVKRARALLNAALFLGALLPFLDQLAHRRDLVRLSDIPVPGPDDDRTWPRLSVIVPACNEEDGVGVAVASMLRQDYPNLEVVLVDDRSTDRTGAIMAELAAAHPGRVTSVAITELPPGWLGKNHAVWTGAQRANGAWLLFADADIVFDPTCFRRAVCYAESAGLDHLTLTPKVQACGYWLDAFVSFFIFAFQVSQRPYMANNPRSKVGIGLGAFNLLSRAAYERMGTHRAISLRPDDDVRLGRRVKQLGLRQCIAYGSDLITVEWYPSMRAAMRGLEKNVYAGLDYRPERLIGGIGGILAVVVWPYLALRRARGLSRWLLLGNILANGASFTYANRLVDRRAARFVPVLPALTLLFCYMFLRAAWLPVARGGIYWRGTFYALDELRSQTGLE